MNGLIRASLNNPCAVAVMAMIVGLIGVLSIRSIFVDILRMFHCKAVHTLTFDNGIPTDGVAGDIKLRQTDCAFDSNSRFRKIEHMPEIPLTATRGKRITTSSCPATARRYGSEPGGSLAELGSGDQLTDRAL